MSIPKPEQPVAADRSDSNGKSPAEKGDRTDAKLLELLVCPLTRGSLEYDQARQELISRKANLAYPIRNGVPLLTRDAARNLDEA